MHPRLVIDNDIFVILCAADLLDLWLDSEKYATSDVYILPTLRHMLRTEHCGMCRSHARVILRDALQKTEKYQRVPVQTDSSLLDKFSSVTEIDVGEAQIFTFMVHHDAMFAATNDKRSLTALCAQAELASRLNGRFYCMEVIMERLLVKFGWNVLKLKIDAMRHREQNEGHRIDKRLDTLFSPRFHDASSTREGLRSFLNDIYQKFGSLLVPRPRG